jgi:methionine-gamma-lyase
MQSNKTSQIMKKSNLHPESLMMSYGYNPQWSEGAVKCPIFQTSTFVFNSAEEGKAHFELAYGLREPKEHEKPGLIYSRLNNPDLEILENRLCLWDKADDAAVFESGMSAITTVLFEFLKPGDLLLYSLPLYGGSVHFIEEILTKFGIDVVGFDHTENVEDIEQRLLEQGQLHRLAMVYIETPANPTNAMIDITAFAELARKHSDEEHKVWVAVDNTYMGPLWQHPLALGADIVLYSATKYIGGHSDLIAGAVLGGQEVMKRVKTLRTFLGNMAGPYTGWLLMRSLETLKLRMERQTQTAVKVATFLNEHPKVKNVYYPGLLRPEDGKDYEIFQRQCAAPGAMLSFDIQGGEHEAFVFLNHLRLIKLAVSLGSTESLAQHPASMTHSGMDPKERLRLDIGEGMVRLSIGVEHEEDLIWDIRQALEAVVPVGEESMSE